MWRYTSTELAAMLGLPEPSFNVSFSGVTTDSRAVEPGQLFVALRGEHFDGSAFIPAAIEAGAAAALGPQSDSGPVIAVDDSLAALQRFAKAHRARMNATIFAVTGSTGKTTSKEFIASVIGTRFKTLKTQGNLNNEIGCPLSLLRLDSDTEFAVIEMGANHRGEIARLCEVAQPDETAITNISEAHLEGFGSIEGVAKAKAEIAEALTSEGTFYANMDDPRCVAIAERVAGRIVRFGTTEAATDVRLMDAVREPNGALRLRIEPIGELVLPLVARAHASNVLLAVAVGLQHGVEDFQTPLAQAAGDTIRVRVVTAGPLEILDDSYNANPASVRAAIDTLIERPGNRKLFAFGEMLELGERAAELHAEIGRYAAEAGVHTMYVRGIHARDTIEAARASGMPRAEAIEEHADIAAALEQSAETGDVLLVKGSRGMAMERVVEELSARFGTQTRPESPV